MPAGASPALHQQQCAPRTLSDRASRGSATVQSPSLCQRLLRVDARPAHAPGRPPRAARPCPSKRRPNPCPRPTWRPSAPPIFGTTSTRLLVSRSLPRARHQQPASLQPIGPLLVRGREHLLPVRPARSAAPGWTNSRTTFAAWNGRPPPTRRRCRPARRSGSRRRTRSRTRAANARPGEGSGPARRAEIHVDPCHVLQGSDRWLLPSRCEALSLLEYNDRPRQAVQHADRRTRRPRGGVASASDAAVGIA